MKLSPLPGRKPTPAAGSQAADELLALRAVFPPVRRLRDRRCGNCGLLFPSSDIRVETDEAGRRIGWVCYGCE